MSALFLRQKKARITIATVRTAVAAADLMPKI